jgi:glycosyltransferase involved in cell wall biosynthesis
VTHPSQTPSRNGSRRRLYVFSPFPPQRNGLADYIIEYLPMLAADFDLHLVAEGGSSAAVKKRFALRHDLQVIDEAEFLSRQPDPQGQTLYNIGNNGDCAYLLEYAHHCPGVNIIHDISLFYLHQFAAQQARMNALMGRWLAEDGYQLPEDFLNRDGSPARTPGLVYQECLMLRRLAASARGVMVHTAYAERRLRGSALGVAFGLEAGRPLARIPHFVLKPEYVLSESECAAVLERFGVEDQHFLMLVPGFLTGNKMLYEVMVAFREAQKRYGNLRLIFAGEERPSEYPVSRRVAELWPDGDGPVVTGYMDADELDVLLGRADLSFVLRFPTYGESSGILPRAAMGGGDVITVDIGAYPEFQSPSVSYVPVNAQTALMLEQAILRVRAAHGTGTPRAVRRAEEASRAVSLSPAALYPRLKALLDQTWEHQP